MMGHKKNGALHVRHELVDAVPCGSHHRQMGTKCVEHAPCVRPSCSRHTQHGTTTRLSSLSIQLRKTFAVPNLSNAFLEILGCPSDHPFPGLARRDRRLPQRCAQRRKRATGKADLEPRRAHGGLLARGAGPPARPPPQRHVPRRPCGRRHDPGPDAIRKKSVGI